MVVDPLGVTSLAIEAAKQIWAMVEAFREIGSGLPDCLGSVQVKSEQVGAAIQLQLLSSETTVWEDLDIKRAKAALEETRDFLYKVVLASSVKRFLLSLKYKKGIDGANSRLDEVMADLRTGEILRMRQDVVRMWRQGLALPGATPAYLPAQAQALQISLPQLPDVPIKYNIEVMKCMARLAKKDADDQQKAVVEVVGLTEASPEGRLQVAAAGMAPMLVKLLREGVDGLKSGALSALANLCKEPGPAASVLAAGAVPLLVQCVQGETMANMDAQAKLQAAEKVMKLVYLPSFVPCSSILGLQGRAERAVVDLSCHGPIYRCAIVSAGAATPLVQLVESQDQQAQAKAVQMLDTLSRRGPESRSALVSAGATTALSKWLEGLKVDSPDAQDTSPLQAQAALLIARLACPGQETASIIPFIVALLDHSDANTQVQAAQAIASLWQECPQHHSTLVNAGAFPRLAGQLDICRPPAVQCAGAESLATILAEYPRDSILPQKNIMEDLLTYALLEALRRTEARLQRYAARALAKLSEWAVCLRHGILATRTITPLLELLMSENEDAQRAARQVLQNLPCDAVHTLELIQKRNEIVLKNLTVLAMDPGQHEGCTCRVCVRKAFHGRRYLCMHEDCPTPPGWDICGSCKTKIAQFGKPSADGKHRTDHAMMLTVTALQIVKAAEGASLDLTVELLELAIRGRGEPPDAMTLLRPLRRLWPRQQ